MFCNTIEMIVSKFKIPTAWGLSFLFERKRKWPNIESSRLMVFRILCSKFLWFYQSQLSIRINPTIEFLKSSYFFAIEFGKKFLVKFLFNLTHSHAQATFVVKPWRCCRHILGLFLAKSRPRQHEFYLQIDKNFKLTPTLADSLCEHHSILICHILTFFQILTYIELE